MVENESEYQRVIEVATRVQPAVFVKDYGHIPLVVANAAYVIEKNIKTKGLFQTKGTASNAMTKLVPTRGIDEYGADFSDVLNSFFYDITTYKSNSLKTINVHDAVEALKTFLATLPIPLLPYHVMEALISLPTNDPNQYVSVLREFHKCWPYNFCVLHFMMVTLSQTGDASDLIQQTGDASDLIQRVPFVIMVMITLIENPDLFKMAAAVSDDLIPEFEKEHYKAELMSAAKERSQKQPIYCSYCSNTTHTRPMGAESSQTSGISARDEPVPLENTVPPGPQEPTVASTVDNAAEINTKNVRETKGNIQRGPAISSAANVTPAINDDADSEVSAIRERILKTSKFKSSPGRKPLRASRAKKATTTRRQKAGTYYSNKRFAGEVVEEKSDSSAHFRTLVLQENIPGRSEKSCSIGGTNSTMTARRGSPKIADAKTPGSKTPGDLVDGEKTAEENSSQTFHGGQESVTNNDRDPLTSIPDNRESAETETDSAIRNKLETVNTDSRVVNTDSRVVNTDSRVVNVPRKGMKHRRKGTLKKHRTRLNLKSGNMCGGVGWLSNSPLPVHSKDPQRRVEGISLTPSCVLFSASTDNNTRTILGTNIKGCTAGDSDDGSVAQCSQLRRRTLATTTHCARSCSLGCCTRHPTQSCSSGCCTRHPTQSCSSGCCTRHPSGSSDFLCDDTTRNSNKTKVTGITHCSHCAQYFVSGNNQEQPSGKNVAPDRNSPSRNSPSRLRNEIQLRTRSPLMQCTPCTNQTLKDLQQIIIVKVFSDPRPTLAEVRPHAAGNRSPLAAQRPHNSTLPEPLSMARTLETIFVMCITLFILYLVMYNLHNSIQEDDVYE